jgi:hypothetical protein
MGFHRLFGPSQILLSDGQPPFGGVVFPLQLFDRFVGLTCRYELNQLFVGLRPRPTHFVGSGYDALRRGQVLLCALPIVACSALLLGSRCVVLLQLCGGLAFIPRLG